ncbi:MAG: AsmA family protein, partial [Gemmatimonadetes bacterium]|nr:AsmA family protein [Gemmatimonadota bacterium]NIR37331.1 AsmA family protein [Actinomycetota bacterium]NIU75202.1 AsmA family protein [Gammaproteobacteria bacterium]NIQ55006.1 AsmA family protein [Gemmatimonadota bacterium]NIX45020.1 AsmA family protein [Gemmatimonadota bacterium]
MKNPRRILLIGAAIAVLLVAAIGVAAALIPGERVARAVAARAEAILGRPVRIEDVGLRVFPLPGVRLSGLAVGDDSAALARVDEVELRARILPLFRGRVVVSRLALERPRVLLEVDSTGHLDLPLSQGDTAGRAGRDISFAVDGIEVEAGRIGFRDLRDGTVVRLDGWNQSLRLAGRVRAGELESVAFTGSIAFEDVDARLPDVVLPIRDVRLRIEHDATLDRAADRLDIR